MKFPNACNKNSKRRHDICKAQNSNARCVRWTTCRKLKGKFSGACGKSVFDVCCSVSSNILLEVIILDLSNIFCIHIYIIVSLFKIIRKL